MNKASVVNTFWMEDMRGMDGGVGGEMDRGMEEGWTEGWVEGGWTLPRGMAFVGEALSRSLGPWLWNKGPFSLGPVDEKH